MNKVCLADRNRQSVSECGRFMGRFEWSKAPLLSEVTCTNCLIHREAEMLGKVKEANKVLQGHNKKLEEVRKRIQAVSTTAGGGNT